MYEWRKTRKKLKGILKTHVDDISDITGKKAIEQSYKLKTVENIFVDYCTDAMTRKREYSIWTTRNYMIENNDNVVDLTDL